MRVQLLWRFALLSSLSIACCTGARAGEEASGPVILDHVRILVRDIHAARDAMRDRLRFNFPAPEPFVYPEGSAHDVTDLADGSALELIGIVDGEALIKARPWIVEFLKHRQGPHSVGFLVKSAQAMSDRLTGQGIDAPVFRLVRTKAVDKPVLLVTPRLPDVPEGAVFFLEYPPRATPYVPKPETTRQANGATGIVAVWIVVRDLEKAGAEIRSLGFRPGRSLESRTLNAVGREYLADQGRIVLLRPNGRGPVAQFADAHQEGVMGVTLGVDDIGRSRAAIHDAAGLDMPEYDGFFGRSALIPASAAADTWIELAQPARQ